MFKAKSTYQDNDMGKAGLEFREAQSTKLELRL